MMKLELQRFGGRGASSGSKSSTKSTASGPSHLSRRKKIVTGRATADQMKTTPK